MKPGDFIYIKKSIYRRNPLNGSVVDADSFALLWGPALFIGELIGLVQADVRQMKFALIIDKSGLPTAVNLGSLLSASEFIS